MTALFDKLNLGTRQSLSVFNAPESFEAQLQALAGVRIDRDPRSPVRVEFALSFVTTRAELDRLSRLLAAAGEGDAVLWFAYPKATSKRYRCEFNRDNGFEVLRAVGFDSVRMVAIDEDWSALRFRRTQYIKAC